ncbi:Fe2+-dependent dioxygenase [Teredinibacter haidensis]|uniref:Fe2+-dependent dioxygenase n=1 Tax=Teredinibacter haidensis TaxID=2731755 RepID=UPI000948DF12|nr:Fe2+-dependent dioxygenase [Teredinibacter haidensis]
MLITIDNLFSKEESENILQKLLSENWQEGKLTAGGVAAQVKQNLQLDDTSATATEVRSNIFHYLKQHPTFISAALPNKIFPPKFNCYRSGGHYGLHVDNAMMTLPDGGYMRTDISATLFFSSPDTYDGGELMIETQYGAQAVKLEAGSMVLYPSSSLHEVRPVTRGNRVCAFFWIQSLVRESSHREQLYELDQSIQSLTLERGAQDHNVARLTGIYHNLLRSRGET